MVTQETILLGAKDVLIIAGPTASGKSGLAVKLATQIGGVVINADSQQVYREMPLLTAQPSPEEKGSIPHFLYSVLAATEVCDAYRWRDMALFEIAAARKNSRVPVLVGGTGLYINALVDGLSPVPDIPLPVRKDAMALLEKIGKEEFFSQLQEKDPATAALLDPANPRRLVRAWEVLEATGRPLSRWQAEPLQGALQDGDFHLLIVIPQRQKLYAHCNERFEKMMAKGALEEVKELRSLVMKGDVDALSPATKALGFRQLLAYLEGRKSLAEAVEESKARTRQYAKRQTTWFRGQLPAGVKSVIRWDPDQDQVPQFSFGAG